MSKPTPLKLAENSIYHGAVQKIRELSSLIEFLQTKSTPSRILEIGSASGGTFWLWCQLASSNATLISLDLPMGRFNNGASYQKKILKSYGKEEQNLHFIRKDSHTTKSEKYLKEILGSNLLDILFIDGDHTYEGVKDDYQRYSKYVAKGGMIIFHDMVYHDAVEDCQVDKFWNEIKESKETYDFIDTEHDDRGWGSWGGLGVIVHS